MQKTLFGFLVTLYKERWEDNKRFLVGRVLLEHLQLLLILLQAQFLWTFDKTYWCAGSSKASDSWHAEYVAWVACMCASAF